MYTSHDCSLVVKTTWKCAGLINAKCEPRRSVSFNYLVLTFQVREHNCARISRGDTQSNINVNEHYIILSDVYSQGWSLYQAPGLALDINMLRICLAIVTSAVAFQVGSGAGSWIKDDVKSGSISYHSASELDAKGSLAIRTCLIDGFGLEAEAAGGNKDVKVFSQFVRLKCSKNFHEVWNTVYALDSTWDILCRLLQLCRRQVFCNLHACHNVGHGKTMWADREYLDFWIQRTTEVFAWVVYHIASGVDSIMLDVEDRLYKGKIMFTHCLTWKNNCVLYRGRMALFPTYSTALEWQAEPMLSLGLKTEQYATQGCWEKSTTGQAWCWTEGSMTVPSTYNRLQVWGGFHTTFPWNEVVAHYHVSWRLTHMICINNLNFMNMSVSMSTWRLSVISDVGLCWTL